MIYVLLILDRLTANYVLTWSLFSFCFIFLCLYSSLNSCLLYLIFPCSSIILSVYTSDCASFAAPPSCSLCLSLPLLGHTIPLSLLFAVHSSNTRCLSLLLRLLLSNISIHPHIIHLLTVPSPPSKHMFRKAKIMLFRNISCKHLDPSVTKSLLCTN